MTTRPKTCLTCAHRESGFVWTRCALSGFHVDTERKYPTVCGKDFQGWIEREPLFRRIKLALIGEKK